VALFSCSLLWAQSNPPLNPALDASLWQAAWIACPDAPVEDFGVFYFRKELTLNAVPDHFWVHVSADNRYQLHVNGVYVGEGPARGDLFHWRFETVDLAPYLHSGLNILAAVVWNFGTDAPVAQMSSRTGFLLQGDTRLEEAVNTGPTWQVKQERARSLGAGASQTDYSASGPGERIDGRVADWNWDNSEDNSGWVAAEVVGHGATREARDADGNWELVPDTLPPMEHRKTSVGEAIRVEGLSGMPVFPVRPLDIPANTHVQLLLDNHVLQTAYPELTVSGGKDATIKLIYSEALYDKDGNKGNRNEITGRHIEGLTDEFIADGARQRTYKPLWWRTWRYLQIDVTTQSAPLRLDGLNAWFTAYPFQEKASIDGDIPQLKQLWDTGWRTARLCAHETYMDAPFWEQLQYVGDTRIQALLSYTLTGDSRLARQAILAIDDSRVPDGLTQSRYPSNQPQFIPPFSLLWIGMIHDYWMYVDDLPLVRKTLPHTRTVIDWYASHLRPDGLLGRVRWWEFGDWTSGYEMGEPPQNADGGSTFLTLQFIEALKDAGELESKYGSQERAREYKSMVAKASAAINRLNWDEQRGVYADLPLQASSNHARTTYSQQANILAVWLDVAPRERQRAILRRVLASKDPTNKEQHEKAMLVEGKPVPPMSQASYYFRFYLSRALDHAGMADEYLNQLGPWYNMLKLGLSTWAERPEPTRSDCHAWSASPNYDLLSLVAGIQPAAQGFARVRIAPHLGNLKYLDATMSSVHGDIQVSYKRNENGWLAIVTLPTGLPGEFVWNGRSIPLHGGEQMFHLSN
jgi:hypothetical protein